jgi:exodeoxyribonuclease V alpha subunit
LTEIYRQAETSDIVLAAHDIFCGKTPRYPGSKQFIMHEVPGESEALDAIQELSQKLYERRDNFQVLSPRHQGKVGVTNLNRVMRETLNPKGSAQTELRVGKETIREGDRAMVVKNDYQLAVFNGDVGKVSRYDAVAKAVVLKLHGPPEMYVTVPQTKVGDLIRMAYAITVHKSQGQEYDTIIMPLLTSFSVQLQRNLLYTAITRAKRRVILVGSSSALQLAVLNNREASRNTLLRDRILQLTKQPLDNED